jgi:lipopolysaccharide heptosyltransferase II
LSTAVRASGPAPGISSLFEHLDIYDRRERTLVGLADAALTVGAFPLRWVRRACAMPPRRILLLRLERIGDLLMTLGAIRAVRELAPHAVIDLVVGSWNRDLASAVQWIDRVELLDAPWLARGDNAMSRARLAARALCWRSQHYDLAINFEGDIRSHLLMAGSLACRRVGFAQAGGGALLTDAVVHDATQHVARNALSLVERAFGVAPGSLPSPETAPHRWRLDVPASHQRDAQARLAELGTPLDGARPLVVMHAPGGRAIKQWPLERFAAVGRRLGDTHAAHLLLTGSPGDHAQVRLVADLLAGHVPVTVADGEWDLVTLAAVLSRADLVVTGDTGPMHLAAAVGTPVVAVFGPSDPRRYGPLISARRIVRVDLPCAPCNRVRMPPARCAAGTPDCLANVTVDAVVHAASELLVAAPSAAVPGH